jgi:hypothetical protein
MNPPGKVDVLSFGQYIIYISEVQIGYVTYNNRKQKLLKNIVYIIYTSKLDFIKIKNRIVDSECGLRISA